MASRGYNGLLVSVVGSQVLINAYMRWTLHEYEDFVSDFDEDLNRATEGNEYLQWYDAYLGGEKWK